MKAEQLDQLLKRVQTAIKSAEGVDQKGRDILNDLDKDIHDLLSRSRQLTPQASIVTEIQKAVEHFEVTHPTLTSVLSEALTILNNAGI